MRLFISYKQSWMTLKWSNMLPHKDQTSSACASQFPLASCIFPQGPNVFKPDAMSITICLSLICQWAHKHVGICDWTSASYSAGKLIVLGRWICLRRTVECWYQRMAINSKWLKMMYGHWRGWKKEEHMVFKGSLKVLNCTCQTSTLNLQLRESKLRKGEWPNKLIYNAHFSSLRLVQASFITVTSSLSHPRAHCKSNSNHFQD